MEFPLVPPLEAGEVLPLSLSQRDVWLDQMAWPGSPHLNIGGGAFLEGPLDIPRFRHALDKLVEETEALRLIPLADGTQFLLKQYRAELHIADLSQETDPKRAIQTWWNRQIRESFSRDGAHPWRFTLLSVSPEFHGLTIQFHHAIMDGWGTTQIMRRWCELYNAPEATNPASNYRQFVDESLRYGQSPAFHKDADYWLSRLPQLPPPLIEARTVLKAARLPEAHLHTHQIPREDYARLTSFANAHGCTVFEVILSAVALYFARTRRCERVTIGVPNLNRGGSRYMGTPGMFVGVMPITLDTRSDLTIEALLQATHKTLREALRHSRYPLSELTSRLKLLREQRNNLFDVLLSFERQDYSLAFGEARLLESRQLFSGISRYPLGITLCEFAQGEDLEMILEGSSTCYVSGEVELLSRRLWGLVNQFVTHAHQTIATIEIVPPEERWALVEGLHQSVSQDAATLPFPSLFVHQARLRPDATALVWPEGLMSYAELDQCSYRLAQTLSPLVNQKDAIVALAVDRSPEMVVAILAIQRAGAAFLPLDPEAPPQRLGKIIQSSMAVALITQSRHRVRMCGLHPTIIEADQPSTIATEHPSPLRDPAPEDLAYVLYTSGSSGEPKGVMVEHAALTHRLNWISDTYQVEWSDRSAQATQYTFDPSLIEICLPLIHGASVALPPAGRLSPQVLLDFVLVHEVTIMAFVPSTLERFLNALDSASSPRLKLRVACTGGEILPAELSNRYLNLTGARLYNVYGPTETVIFTTAWQCQPSPPDQVLPIGRCIDNSRIYVLDEEHRLLPFGERGEIYIGGRCVARGYLNDTAQSAAAFIDDPFQPGQRMYRSGDIGWIACDGNLHFSGRQDRQVKLRGYRIELGEIEAALLSLPGVSRAAVSLVYIHGQAALHAWISAPQTTPKDAFRLSLRSILPDYMVPSTFSVLESMPETSTGKIDFSALPSPEPCLPCKSKREPKPGLETDMVILWEHALGKKNIHVSDDFFELGGDSLAIIDIIAGLEKRLGRRIPLQLIIEYPTIERLAREIDTSGASTFQSLLALSKSSKAPPLYLVASGHGDLIRFQALAHALAPTFSVFMLQPPTEVPNMNLDDLADQYASLIATQHREPVHLAGFSVGGISALETSRRLIVRGIPVVNVILIDTLYPYALLRAKRLWHISEWLIKKLHIQELSLNGRKLDVLFSDTGLVMQINALEDYSPRPYAGRLILIKSSGLQRWQRWLFKPWRKLATGDFSEWETSGLHGSMFEANNIDALARVIKQSAERRR